VPHYYLVLGPGISANGAEVTASRNGQSHQISGLPAGAHSWQVVPYWKVGGEIVGDVTLGARVTATILPASISHVSPRTIQLSGFSATGTAVTVPPRTISLTGFAATGTAIQVPPRTVTLSGWTSNGPFPAIQGVVK